MTNKASNWKEFTLKEISQLITKGTTPTTYGHNFVDRGINFIKIENIDNFGNIDIENVKHISEQTNKFLRRSQLEENDILFSIAGALGRTAIIKKGHLPANTNQALAIIRLKDKSLVKFIELLLNSDAVLKQTQNAKVQLAQANISLSELSSIKISIPAASLQKQISETIFTIEQQIAISKKVASNSIILRYGLINQLLTKGIGHKQFKQTEIGGIPDTWKVLKLRNVAKFTNGKGHEAFITDNGEYTVINSKFISTEGEVLKRSNKNLSPLFKNDIAMVMSDIPKGKALAKCFLVDEDGKYTLNQRICSLKPMQMISKFLFYVLNRNTYFINFDNGVGQTNLRKDEVLDCPIQIPPIDEQEKIVEILSMMDQQSSANKKLIDKLILLKKGLMQDIFSQKVQI